MLLFVLLYANIINILNDKTVLPLIYIKSYNKKGN